MNNPEKTNKYKNCQSCGMPLKKSPNGGGTDADGSINLKYCAYCFENGKFKQPDWTAEQMRSFVKNKLKEMGFPGFIAGFFARSVNNLERWKK